MASLASKLYKIQFRPGLRPGPRWGSLRRSPNPLVPKPLPISYPLDAFGVSLSTLSASNPRRRLWPPLRISGYATEEIEYKTLTNCIYMRELWTDQENSFFGRFQMFDC